MAEAKSKADNVMLNSIHIDKVTINIGSGKDQYKLEKGLNLLEKITGKKPIKTLSKHRIATWGIRLGLPIGCKVTVRGKDAIELLNRLLIGVDNRINPRCFDKKGNFSFGVKDYIEVEGMKYDPDIGMMGFEVCVTLKRKGSRVALRAKNAYKIGKRQAITTEQAQNYIKDNFKVIFTTDKEDEE